ncbi:MAG: tetratricopeptide repeat protein [Rhodothermales bacterium]
MTNTLASLDERLQALRDRGEETTETVDVLIEVAAALRTDNLDRILAVTREAYALAQRLGYTRGMAYSLGYNGFARYMLSDHEAAYGKLEESIALFEGIDDLDGLALSMTALASVQLSLGQYEQSLANGMKALKLFQQTGNRVEEAWTLVGFGGGYVDVGAYDRALQFYRDALAIFEDLDERVGEARALNGIGTVYLHLEHYEDALPYYNKSLTLFEETGNRIGEARALNDIGIIHHRLGDYEEALRLHHQSLQIREEVGNRQSQSTSLIQLGRIYIEQNEMAKALDVLHRALAIAEDIKAKPRVYQAHEALADAYERRGDLDRALTHFKAFHRVREDIQGEEAQAAINNIQVRFEVEKAEQDAEIERLRNVELKEKNDELEQVLQKLKTTQTQLVQSAKMASLGQLTAGIAHEIKNPLNFINNFAVLSIELADELSETLDAHADPDGTDIHDDLGEILDDLKLNARKIAKHGRRADGIVRSMLEHSRSTAGARMSTDVNALLEEYLKLCYHGLCAQQDDFPILFRRAYGETVGTVSAVPQELGRVFFNLFHNAFYAVQKKKQTSDAGYVPTIRVHTSRVGNEVEIRVQDNGPGIPAEVQEKMFEPFFTTKPTGTGTGLGLSISYDIVVQGHGGDLRAESEEGMGSTFVITLPG